MTDSLVLVHGYHLAASHWEDVLWGEPEKGRFGRLPRALLEALRTEEDSPATLHLGTGASTRDGRLEVHLTHELALSHLDDFAHVAAPLLGRGHAWTHTMLSALLHEHIILDTRSTDTRSETIAAMESALERGITRLTLVSSPTHIARCFQLALSLVETPRYAPLALGLSAVSSSISYAHSTPADVVVLEPPHRPDRPAIPFHQTIKPLFSLLNDPALAAAYNEEWALLLAEYTRRLPATRPVPETSPGVSS